jgi:MFS family permease
VWNQPRVVWAVAAGRFVNSASSFLMLFLTLYLTGPRGLGVVAAGLVTGTSGVGMLAGNFTGGRWGDRHGHRRTALATATASGLLVVSVPWLPVWLLPVTLPVSAYLSATSGVSLGALTALAVPRGERRTMVAISRAASNAGFVIGPPLGALLATWSYDALFLVDGGLLLASRFALAPLLPDLKHAVDGSATGFLTALRADRALLRLLGAVVVVDLVYRQLYSTVPLHLRDAGMPLGLYAAIIAIGSGLILLLEVPTAMWLRGCSSYPIIAAGYALVGVGFALFGLPVSVATSVLAIVVLTAGEILYKTTATAHVLDAAPDHLVGQYQGLYGGASTSGSLLAAPIGGALYAVAPGALWPLLGVLAVGAAASVLAGRPRQPQVCASLTSTTAGVGRLTGPRSREGTRSGSPGTEPPPRAG